jgi:hypothetical protein
MVAMASILHEENEVLMQHGVDVNHRPVENPKRKV